MRGARDGSRLVIFDVDGTLTATNAVDDECFRRAMGTVLGVEITSVGAEASVHATDSYISRALGERHLQRTPSESDVARMTTCFVNELRAELARAPERFAAIPGAQGLFDVLRRAGWSIAVATGGWGPSARLKLAAAGLAEPDLIIACASDATTRREIVSLAAARAVERHGHGFERIVSVGDRPWDVRTAAELELPFIGVGVGAKARAMREVGAAIVVPDLRDHAHFCRALETATAPAA